MNAGMFISGPVMRVAAVALAGLLATGAAQARSNPVDPVSNPNGLDYSDVHMTTPKYDEPFQRDGVVFRPGMFTQISAGMPGAAVESLIGKPLSEEAGRRGREWNFNFKFFLPQSRNYLVCQYKVVLGADQKVLETVWRREQCLDIVSTASAG